MCIIKTHIFKEVFTKCIVFSIKRPSTKADMLTIFGLILRVIISFAKSNRVSVSFALEII